MATFHFDLVSPEKLLFSGEVDQVDVPGTEGDFGVLAGHAPLVSALRPGIMTVTVNGQAQRMVVLGGFAEVSADGKLTVLADLADSVEEFDRDLIAQRITAQEEKIKSLRGQRARPRDRAARSLQADRQPPAGHGDALDRAAVAHEPRALLDGNARKLHKLIAGIRIGSCHHPIGAFRLVQRLLSLVVLREDVRPRGAMKTRRW